MIVQSVLLDTSAMAQLPLVPSALKVLPLMQDLLFVLLVVLDPSQKLVLETALHV